MAGEARRNVGRHGARDPQPAGCPGRRHADAAQRSGPGRVHCTPPGHRYSGGHPVGRHRLGVPPVRAAAGAEPDGVRPERGPDGHVGFDPARSPNTEGHHDRDAPRPRSHARPGRSGSAQASVLESRDERLRCHALRGTAGHRDLAPTGRGKRAGYGVSAASDGEEAIAHIDKELFDLVITDLKMPKAGGLDVLRAVKESSPESVVLIITAFASAESAVEAMKLGAYDYLTKPFQVDEVQLIVRNALEKRRLSTENMLLKREGAGPSPTQIIGESEAMRKVFEMVRKVADTKSNVLISGESGTGKELIARAIHNNSGRSRLPFVTVNCSAMPEPLLESELFGHMKIGRASCRERV